MTEKKLFGVRTEDTFRIYAADPEGSAFVHVAHPSIAFSVCGPWFKQAVAELKQYEPREIAALLPDRIVWADDPEMILVNGHTPTDLHLQGVDDDQQPGTGAAKFTD